VQKSIQCGSDLNVRPETLKELEQNVDKTLQELSIGNNFLNSTLIAQERRHMELHEIKNLKHIKGNNYRSKEYTEWKKIFANYSTDMGIMSRIIYRVQKLNTKRTNNPINK
jgi:hypothetical protein